MLCATNSLKWIFYLWIMMVIWGILENWFPPIGYDFPAVYNSGSCTCLCVQAVETIVEPCPRLDLNWSRSWEPELPAGFHWYWLRICPWVFCLGWDQLLAVLCLAPKSALDLVQMKPRWKRLSPGAHPVCSSSQWTLGRWDVGVAGQSRQSNTPL